MKISKYILFLLSSFIFNQLAFGQKLDRNIYFNFVKADSSEFIKYAQQIGFTTEYDITSKVLFAKTKGFVFGKPLAETGNASYVLTLVVSTLDKENNKIILQNAKPVESKKDTWIDDKYLYIEWDLENPISKEMWYKVLIYRHK